MTPRMVLRLSFSAVLLCTLANATGCSHCRTCAPSSSVGLGHPVATANVPTAGDAGTSGWTCRVTLFDQPRVPLLERLDLGTVLRSPVASGPQTVLVKAPAAHAPTGMLHPALPPKGAEEGGVVAKSTMAGWMTPPAPAADPVTAVGGVSAPPPTKTELTPLPMPQERDASTRGPLRRAVRRAIDRIVDDQPGDGDPFHPATGNVERIEKMPRETTDEGSEPPTIQPTAGEKPRDQAAETPRPLNVVVQVFTLEDSVQEGKEASCLVHVMNEGTEPVRDLIVWADFSSNLKPTGVLNGPLHALNGQRVKIDLPEILAGGTRVLRINARAVKTGDAKVVVKLVGEEPGSFVLAEEKVRVYK